MFRSKDSSRLYHQDSFYDAFMHDLRGAKSMVIIESPFITTRRMENILPVIHRLTKRGVQVIINTKPLNEHQGMYHTQAQNGIARLQEIGAIVLMTVGHHRKVAIIDQLVTWEGSLNILSQSSSCEIMRRIQSKHETKQMVKFLRLDRFYKMK